MRVRQRFTLTLALSHQGRGDFVCSAIKGEGILVALPSRERGQVQLVVRVSLVVVSEGFFGGV